MSAETIHRITESQIVTFQCADFLVETDSMEF